MQRVASGPYSAPTPRIRYKHHGFLNNVADPNQIKCDNCQKLFGTEQGLQLHQSRDTAKNFGCHRLQINTQKQTARAELLEKKNNINSVKLEKYHINVSQGPHPKGSLITAKEKKCILNLYQSYLDDGNKTEVEAREETGRRLQFGDESIRSIIKEYLYERKVEENKSIRMTSNVKFDAVMKNEFRKLIHTFSKV